MKHLIVLFITMLMVAGCGTGKPSSAPSSVNEVRVLCGEYAGMGTILAVRENEVYVSTAYHILRNGTDLSPDAAPAVTFEGGAVVSAEIVYMETEEDICILRTKEKGTLSANAEGVFSEEKNTVPSEEGTVYLFDEEGEMHSGSVTDAGADVPGVGRDLLRFVCTVKEGMSGCGVYTKDGSFAGMLIAGDDNHDAAAVKAERVFLAFSALED